VFCRDVGLFHGTTGAGGLFHGTGGVGVFMAPEVPGIWLAFGISF
jgi:hypothetical protein